MQPTTKPSNRLDALDIEAFETMLASEPFRFYRERVDIELARAQNDCENANDERELRRAQGAAKALRVVLALPEMILKTMKDGKKP